MSRQFVTLQSLGNLEIIDIYVYYDKPHLFSCKNKTGQRYLAICSDEDDDSERWLYVPISSKKLRKVKTGQITVYSAFKEPEDGTLFDVRIYFSNNMDSAEIIKPEALDDSDLPDKDTFLNCDNNELAVVSDYHSSIQEALISDLFDASTRLVSLPELDIDSLNIAMATSRDVLDICLEVDGKHEKEISCDNLGAVLVNLQSLIYSLAYKDNKFRGRVPKDIKDKNIMKVVMCHAASFGILLQSNESADILGETPSTNSLKLLSTLLSAKNQKEELTKLKDEVSPKAFYKYRNFLSSLVDGNMDIKVGIASANKYCNDIEFKQAEIYSTIDILESDFDNTTSINTYIGDLVGINTKKNTFMFISSNDDYYSGTLANELLKNKYTVPSKVEVVIKECLEINPMTQREKVYYELLEIKYLQ